MKRAIFILCFAPILFFGCESGKSNKLGQGGASGGDLKGYNCASIHRCVKHCGPDKACQAGCVDDGSVDGAKRYLNLTSCIGYNCMFLSEEETADCINEVCANELWFCGLNDAEAGDFEPSAPGSNVGDSGDSAADSGDSGADSGANSGDSGNSGANSGDSGSNSGDSGDSGGELPACGKGISAPCLDSATGLVWSAKANAGISWANAKTYCEDLSEGGFSDWRLPTISELRTLIRECPATMSGGSCGVVDGCISDNCWSDFCQGCASDSSGKYSLFGDIYCFWSSSFGADDPGYAWSVNFSNGRVDGLAKDGVYNIRCVRGNFDPDSAADSGDSGADSGDSGSDSGDSAADSGDSGADSGDSGADSGDSGSNSGDSGDSGGFCGDGFIQREDCSGYEDKGCKVVPGTNEFCDDGDKNGKYNHCKSNCSGLGDFCGDGVKNGPEFCDDGENNGKYNHCKSNCSGLGDFCGDGVKNGPEVCDDGDKNGKYNRCKSNCSGIGDFCGDGVKNGPEICDDGENNGEYGRCKSDCSGMDDTGDSGDSGDTGDSGSGLPSCGKGSATPCLDSKSGLVWSAKASDPMTWNNAKTHCNNLTEGGFSDWRLPTISELRTLIRNCPATMTGGSCGVTDSCLESSCWSDPCGGCGSDNTGKYSLFGDTSWFWSSSPVADGPDYAWCVDFNGGNVYRYDVSNGNGVRCVR